MRKCEKEYYNKMLEDNKNSIMGIRSVLNSIIRNGTRVSSYPQYFIDNNKTINNINNVVKEFNNFF